MKDLQLNKKWIFLLSIPFVLQNIISILQMLGINSFLLIPHGFWSFIGYNFSYCLVAAIPLGILVFANYKLGKTWKIALIVNILFFMFFYAIPVLTGIKF